MIKKELPLYKMLVDEEMDSEAQVDFVALVPNPAIEKNFQTFNTQLKFKIDNEEQHIISGPLMLADLPIYRNDDRMGEYFVVFDKENIMKACQKFFKSGYQKNVNLFHDPEQCQSGVTMFESFICDEQRGISPMKGFEDAKDGSWFGSFKVDNPDLWTRIKAGEFTGFSVEGIFGVQRVYDEQAIMKSINDVVKSDKSIDEKVLAIKEIIN